VKICRGDECDKKGELQPMENFYAHSQKKDGRINLCKDCSRKRAIINRREGYQRRSIPKVYDVDKPLWGRTW